MRRLIAKVANALRPTSRVDTGKVTITYAPDRDGDADPGEVVWAWVPYEEDATQGKDRPVLIVGWDGQRLVGVPLSSRTHDGRRDASSWIAVGVGAWDRERRPSYADAERLLRFAPRDVRREGAALDRTRFDAVVTRVRQLHGRAAFTTERQ
jgi:hypothetical protein